VTAVKRVPSSTAEVSPSTAADVGAPVPQIVSGVAALADVTVRKAALAAANAMVVAKATRTLDARIGRACFGELIGVLPLDC